MALKLANEKNAIKLYQESPNDYIYYVGKDNGLSDIRIVGGDRCSDWVLQILGKTWLDNSKILYELAHIIQSECPDNDIDWEATFFIVEKKEYLDHVKGLKGSSDFWEGFRIGQEESTSEVHAYIEKIVSQNLADYGLS